ncbi:ankyrin repeat domain-containing protein [uncultured Bacteroides sp.]|uniref:ankyrin repeat domain-containing protein n=1 Tax=uncultured Bacteroides sp. TaxID=162156 RepID=UPI002639B384|nr:ankyrin repeat domain-containing protein [uncultured Bacteroides sp.]
MKLDIKNYPLILKLICGIVLLPILAAPLVFYSTIFFFDNPSSEGEAFCWFLAVNSYSLILLGICWASVWLYSKIRKADLASLPFLFYLILIFVGYWYFTDGPIDKDSVTASDYRLYRDTPCEELAKCINRQNIENINQILEKSPDLLEYKEDKFNQNVFFYAIYDDKIKSVETLLKKGANPNQIDSYTHEGQKFITCPLSSVCESNISEEKKIRYVQLFLNYGADLNTDFIKEYIGDSKWCRPSTPLSKAAHDGNLKLVKFLLDNGAAPNYTYSKLDAPPLQEALIFNHYKVAEELLKRGADPDLRFYERNTSVREELIDDINNPNLCIDTDKDVKERKRLLELIQSLE